MRLSMLLLLLALGFSGCVTYSGTSTPPQNTIVVPPGSTVYCSNGSAPPCQ
jgi:hypothetical protein